MPKKAGIILKEFYGNTNSSDKEPIKKVVMKIANDSVHFTEPVRLNYNSYLGEKTN